MPSRLFYGGGEVVLSDDEREALAWLVHPPSFYRAPDLRHLRNALNRGGTLDGDARQRLSADLQAARGELVRTLEAWTPKYGANTGMGSKAGFALIKRNKLRYSNHNVSPPATYVAGRRASGPPQTLGDVPELTSGLEKLEAAVEANDLRIEHDQTYEGF